MKPAAKFSSLRASSAKEPTPSASELVESLHSLHNGQEAVNHLIAMGPQSLEPLRRFLLEGKPASIYQPRCWAVEALAGIGAAGVLLEFLRRPVEVSDPVARHGEQAVRNAAARELGAWSTEDIFQALLDVLREEPLAGAIEALERFRRPETVPYLIDALEDDVSREASIAALQQLGDIARPALLETARICKPPAPETESRSSLRRRQSALRVLAEAALRAAESNDLRPLLTDRDPEIVTVVAQILLHDRDTGSVSIRRNLQRVLPQAGWWLKDEIRELLSKLEAGSDRG